MYQIYCGSDLLYDPREQETCILSGNVSLGVNETGKFEFSISPLHPLRRSIQKLKSVIKVYEGHELLYEGRVLLSETDMYGVTSYTCEGELAYLLDSIQRPKEYHDLTPRTYIADKLAQHNSRVEDGKKFTLGTIEKQSMNYDAREDNQYTSTLKTIMDKLVGSNGGYLRVRKENGVRYLDYLETYGRTSGQTIRFGENILDLNEHISAEDLLTVLIPLGKAPEGAENGTKLTIASVNNGKDYLENEEAISIFGRIEGVKEWSDVTLPANLKKKGQEYLKDMMNMKTTIELTALDLHLVDVEIDRLQLGDMVRVVSVPHGIDRYMMISKREYNLLDPSADKIVLGDTIAALTEKQMALQKEVNKQKNVTRAVEELKSNVSIISREVDDTKQEISGITGKVQVLESSAADTQLQIQEMHNRLNENGKDIQELRSKDVQFQADIEDILSRLNVLEEGGSTS